MMAVLEQTVAPTTEPLCLADAKAHMRVEIDDDDEMIVGLIKTARAYIENATWRQLISATWKWYLPGFPRVFFVPKPPLQSAGTSITYVDSAGATQTLAASVYDVNAKSSPGRIVEAYAQGWPSTRDDENAVIVTFVAGYGNSASDVPDPLVKAMKLMVSQLYENREPVTLNATPSIVPYAMGSMLEPYSMAGVG